MYVESTNTSITMVSTTTQDLQHNTQAAATTDTFVAFAALLRHADAPVGSCTYVCMADECAPLYTWLR